MAREHTYNYVNEVDILVIHDHILEATGGMDDIRDIKLLRSVAFRPKTACGGKDMFITLFDKASAYYEALACYHVFNDANKRTAFVVTARSLEQNGYTIIATEKAIEKTTLAVAAQEIELADIALWLKKNSKKINTRR